MKVPKCLNVFANDVHQFLVVDLQQTYERLVLLDAFIIHVRIQSKHYIILSKERSRLKITHIIVILIIACNISLLYQIKILNFILVIQNKLFIRNIITLHILHELANNDIIDLEDIVITHVIVKQMLEEFLLLFYELLQKLKFQL